MLNDDHRRNLNEKADSVGSSIHTAWTYFQILKGLQEAAAHSKEWLLMHSIAFDSIYRAVFDALYVSVGAVTDRARATESINSLVTMARGYPIDESVRIKILKALSDTQNQKGSPLERLKNWRNKHAAHKTAEALTPDFYTENKLNLAEVEAAITILDQALSEIAYALLGNRYSLRPSTENVAANCAALFRGK